MKYKICHAGSTNLEDYDNPGIRIPAKPMSFDTFKLLMRAEIVNEYGKTKHRIPMLAAIGKLTIEKGLHTLFADIDPFSFTYGYFVFVPVDE